MTAQALGREWRLAASVTLEHQKSGFCRFFDAFYFSISRMYLAPAMTPNRPAS